MVLSQCRNSPPRMLPFISDDSIQPTHHSSSSSQSTSSAPSPVCFPALRAEESQCTRGLDRNPANEERTSSREGTRVIGTFYDGRTNVPRNARCVGTLKREIPSDEHELLRDRRRSLSWWHQRRLHEEALQDHSY